MIFNYYKLLLLFTFLQPFINSITGISIKYHLPSVAGPLFYIFIIIVSIVYLLMKKKIEIVLFFIVFNTYFLLVFYTERTTASGYFDLLKVVLPYIIFLSVRSLSLSEKRMYLLIRAIKLSFLIYAMLIILSFIFSYQIQSGKGYFGLIYAGNDLILLLMLAIFFYSILNSDKKIRSEIFIVFSYLLTGSKSIILFFTAFVVEFVNRKNIMLKIFFIIIFVSLFFYFILPLYERKIVIFFEKADTLEDLFEEYDTEYILNILTFGRSEFMFDMIQSNQKTILDYIIGSGQIGAAIITNGKIGAEMDPVDAFNIYGIIGLFFLFSFYYMPIIKLKINQSAKILFLIIVLYSILGGHFYNNPLVGFYYGLILGLLQNKNQTIIRKHFEVSNSNKYTSTL